MSQPYYGSMDLRIEQVVLLTTVPEETQFFIRFDCGCQAVTDVIWSHDAGWHHGLHVCTTTCHFGCVYSYAISEAYKYC